MRHLLALPAVLRTAAFLASASQQSFSVQDDILAFPQYEVRFVDEWTHHDDAAVRLSDDKQQASSDRNGDAESQIQRYQFQQPLGTHSDGGSLKQDEGEAEYERMILDGQPWLCRIPKVKKPDETGTNETLSKAEEEKELARANDRGWELLSGMQNNCVFFISGWWSYRFCYNQGVKQFHQLPPSRGVPVYPPMEDPGVPGFMLGTYEKRLEDDDAGKERDWAGESALDMSEGAKRKYSKHGELVQRGESRYLVQKLGGGTLCDLTGKERKIEVQFHCSPQATDRISLIKETSTCAYLMVIQTPRLCNDVAFLPPQKDQPNPISCSPILHDEEIDQYELDMKAVVAAEREANIRDATAEAAAAMGDTAYQAPMYPIVGDIYIGEHRLVPDGVKIEKSAIVGGGKETYIDTVANSDGHVVSKEDLEKLGLGDPRAIEKLKKQLEKIAQGQNWKLDVIDTPRGREYRGIIGDEEEEEGAAGSGKDGAAREGGAEGRKTSGEKKAKPTQGTKKDTERPTKGSEEEYYQEEL